MKVTINNKQHETQAVTLSELATQLQLPAKGVAIAVDNQLKPRGSWGDVAIQEGASITIIKAACGGEGRCYSLYLTIQKSIAILTLSAWPCRVDADGYSCV